MWYYSIIIAELDVKKIYVGTDICSGLLTQYEKQDDTGTLLARLVTVGESWIQYCDVETKMLCDLC